MASPMNRLLKTVATMGSACGAKGANVALLGAAGGIGQPLALLLKKLPGIATLNLYDVSTAVKGVAADLSHIDTPAHVTAFVGADLNLALTNIDIVVIPAGVPRKPGMTRDDLFNVNASIVCKLVAACAKACPNAFILVVTNPVNSTVPIAAEVLKRYGVYNPKKLLGVTSLDVVRANTFLAEKLNMSPSNVDVPVIGGHAGITIIPLLSQVPGAEKLHEKDVKELTKRIMFGGDEVVAAKEGKGSATLSMAHAAAKLVSSVLKTYCGQTVTECAFVESDAVKGLSFFASPVVISSAGVQSIAPLPALSPFEEKLVKNAKKELSAQIQKGVKYGQTFKL